jgi:sugar diacid utilization regulator
MLHAVDDVVAALAEGYQLARRALVRAQESERREFIDDLLNGATDVVGVLHRATGFGLDLAGPHAVATVRAERSFTDGLPLIAALERSILGLKGDAQALLASKEGRLVVVFAAPDRAAVSHVVGQLAATLGKARTGRTSVGDWQLGVGRAGTGADGVVSSYRESVDALDLAERLELATPVVDARDLLVYQVLLRDRATLADLVESTLGSLPQARGGAAPLVATLAAYFAAGGNTAACARQLHLSVRAVTYRLDRIRALTGLDPDRPDDRFALHVAVLGARLLRWPQA